MDRKAEIRLANYLSALIIGLFFVVMLRALVVLTDHMIWAPTFMAFVTLVVLVVAAILEKKQDGR